MRLLFVSDPHGADLILKKSITAIKRHEVDVFILAGDLTSKDVRPIIQLNNSEYKVNYQGKNEIVSKSQIEEVENKLSSYGHYYFHCNSDEFQELNQNQDKIFKILDQKLLEKIDFWARLLIREIDTTKVKLFITPGNDDNFDVDRVLNQYEKDGIYTNLNQPYKFEANEMITVDFSNPTPWKTDRELPEKKLEKLINKRIELLKNPNKAIFNFHCPPHKTKIDLAPELDKNLKPVIIPGADNKVHVGSTAVRNTIEKFQPVLSLHGHIHESPGNDYIGNTFCLNPGSEYEKGFLYGYIIDFDRDGNVSKYFRIEG